MLGIPILLKLYMTPTHHTLQSATSSGFHTLHYTEWGASDNPNVVICAHGLTRCCRDFDVLAARLSSTFRVICPDAAGRGESAWLTNKADYSYPQYIIDSTALLARVSATSDATTVQWLGTSMGGILGMLLASMPNSPIKRLVVNDAGTHIPKESLQRIGMFVGKSPQFASLQNVIDAVKSVSPFGPLSESQWHDLTLPLVKQNESGAWQFRYDPGVGNAFRIAPAVDVDLSPYWNAITCPTLLLRGALSDLLLPETYAAMCDKAGVTGLEIADAGHAPMLQDAPTQDAIIAFLSKPL
jgi:pimeloyl-ACP methyl ester carboxylesterase